MRRRGLVMGAIVLGVLLVILGIGGYWFLKTTRQTEEGSSEMQRIVHRLERHMVLPKNEEPTLATITDKEKLQPGSFLARGADGDKVLIYVKAKRVIIYRPKIDRIVDVGPVSIAEPNGAPVSNTIK